MTANEIIEILHKESPWEGKTCDTIKSGNPEKEITKVAVSMFATVDTVKKAKEWGADMLVVHEPTYYEHFEQDTGSKIAAMKKKIIEESGLIIYRYHDHPHAGSRERDMISDGGAAALGLTGKMERVNLAIFRLLSDEPVTARELAHRMEKDMGLSFVRVCGELDYPSRKIALCFGTPPLMDEIIEDDENEIILTGETCEWNHAERVRDACAMGIHKSMIVMTHIGSEREGMKLFVERFTKKFPQIETKYFECEEVYKKY